MAPSSAETSKASTVQACGEAGGVKVSRPENGPVRGRPWRGGVALGHDLPVVVEQAQADRASYTLASPLTTSRSP